jgi:hypothetical protein
VQVVGRVLGGRFQGTPATPLEDGDCLYAAAVSPPADGRQLLWGWLRETVPDERLAALEPVGALSLPMDCSLEGGRLVLRPVPELAALRRSGGVRTAPQDLGPLVRPAEVELTLGKGVVLLELGPQESVSLLRAGRWLTVDRSRASLATWAPTAPVHVRVPDRPFRVGLLLDGSLLVILVDGVLGAVVRLYPLSPRCGALRTEGDARDAQLWLLGLD